jgi:hypothetical protein
VASNVGWGPKGQRDDADDLHAPLQVVGQHVQSRFRADMLQCLHLEVGKFHPTLDDAEGALNGFPPLMHFLRVLVEPLLDGFQHILVLPVGDAALLARGALIIDHAVRKFSAGTQSVRSSVLHR